MGLRPRRGSERPADVSTGGRGDDYPDLKAFFDEEFYRAQAPSVSPRADAWRHYLRQRGAGQAAPNAYLDVRYFARQTGSRLDRPVLVECMELLSQGVDPPVHQLFDAEFYRAANPEIGADAPWLHFVLHGDVDSRSPSAAFDSDFYRRTYLPLRATHPFKHYVTLGRGHGLLPRPILRGYHESGAAMGAALTHDTVVLVGHDAQQAGAPLLLVTLARELRRRGTPVVFVVKRAGPLADEYAKYGRVFVLAEGWDIAGLVESTPPHVPVIASTVVCSDLAARYARRGRTLSLVHEYPDVIDDLGCHADVSTALGAGVVHGFVLASIRDRFARAFHMDVADPRLAVVGFAPYDDQPSRYEYARARRRLGCDADSRSIVAGAAYADHRKGFDLFLAVVAELQRRGRADLRFIWFGELGPWAEELAAQAQERGVVVEYPGYVEPMQAYLAQCAVLAVTSRSDTGPGTVQTAALEGVPTVAFDTELGAAEFIPDVGALVARDDVADFASAVEGQVNSSQQERCSRITQARRFTVGPFVDRVLDAATGARERGTGGSGR